MDLLEVGKIVNTHGLRGEVKVVPWTDYPEVFEDIDFVYVKKKSEYERLDVKGIKYQKNNLIVRFSQITDINMAEKYKNQVIYAEREFWANFLRACIILPTLSVLILLRRTAKKSVL